MTSFVVAACLCMAAGAAVLAVVAVVVAVAALIGGAR